MIFIWMVMHTTILFAMKLILLSVFILRRFDKWMGHMGWVSQKSSDLGSKCHDANIFTIPHLELQTWNKFRFRYAFKIHIQECSPFFDFLLVNTFVHFTFTLIQCSNWFRYYINNPSPPPPPPSPETKRIRRIREC